MIVKIETTTERHTVIDDLNPKIEWVSALENDRRFIYLGDGSVLINKDHIISVSFEESGGIDVKND